MSVNPESIGDVPDEAADYLKEKIDDNVDGDRTPDDDEPRDSAGPDADS